VAVNHAFRTQQAGVTRLDWWGVYSNPGRAGSNTVCSFKAVLPSR